MDVQLKQLCEQLYHWQPFFFPGKTVSLILLALKGKRGLAISGRDECFLNVFLGN